MCHLLSKVPSQFNLEHIFLNNCNVLQHRIITDIVYNNIVAVSGIGYGIAVSVFSVVTYYCSLMSVTLYYMLASCQSVLPWTVCWEEWGDDCFSSTAINNETANVNKSSSADLYFRWACFTFYKYISASVLRTLAFHS